MGEKLSPSKGTEVNLFGISIHFPSGNKCSRNKMNQKPNRKLGIRVNFFSCFPGEREEEYNL